VDPIAWIVGPIGIAVGVVNLLAWIRGGSESAKAQAMRRRYGENRGNLIHGLSYGVLPLVVGVIFLL
jgi:hypothetical protein